MAMWVWVESKSNSSIFYAGTFTWPATGLPLTTQHTTHTHPHTMTACASKGHPWARLHFLCQYFVVISNQCCLNQLFPDAGPWLQSGRCTGRILLLHDWSSSHSCGLPHQWFCWSVHRATAQVRQLHLGEEHPAWCVSGRCVIGRRVETAM